MRRFPTVPLALAFALLALVAGGGRAAAAPLRVVATTPDLGSLVRAVGGDAVAVTVLGRPAEDPHFIEARPSYVRELSTADLLVVNGLELETGYVPVLLTGSRNARVQRGADGFLDASVAITPRLVPSAPVDRSQGDVHPFGNPHYLLDPLNGLKVAALLRDTLGRLRPDEAAAFDARYEAFRRRLAAALVGESLAARFDAEKLAVLHEHGRLLPLLEQQGERAALGGWLGALAPYAGSPAVDDHPIWIYFAARFGLRVIDNLEPKPGIPPTTRHLQQVVELMKAQHVRLILASAYYDPRHAELVASETGARVARMANQVGSRPGTDEYIAMFDYNVRQVVEALR